MPPASYRGFFVSVAIENAGDGVDVSDATTTGGAT